MRTAQTLLYAFELGSQDLRVVPSGVWQVLDSIDGSSSSCVHAQPQPAQPQPAQPQPAQPQPAQPHAAPPQPNIDFMQGRRQTISTRRQGRDVRTAQTLLYAFELGSQDLRVVPSGVWQVLRHIRHNDWQDQDNPEPESTAGEGIYACYNEGSCIYPDRCSCPDGWTGFDCQTPLCRHKQTDWKLGRNLIASCLNGGLCVNKDNCTCIQTRSVLHLTFPDVTQEE